MDFRQGALEGLVMDTAFWRGKRVLLTGHTGFKGSWLSLWLQSMESEVVGYALAPPTTPSLFEVAKVGAGMTNIVGDIRDFGHLRAVFAERQPEIVMHMAAQSLVRSSYIEPVETYATNVMGTVHLLEAARGTASVKAVVNVTSDKCYENHEWVWGYRENEAMGGYDPYSSSKGCAELITAAYRNSYFTPEPCGERHVALASVRAGNVIGGGDWADDRLVPDIMRAVTLGLPVRIRSPRAIRPWQHVLEPLHGYLLLAQKLYEEGAAYAEAWNFGPNDDDARPVQWIVERLTASWSKEANWLPGSDPTQPHEAHFLKLDSSKAKARLAWSPKWSLEEALNAIIGWYRAYGNGKDMHDITLGQIRNFIREQKP